MSKGITFTNQFNDHQELEQDCNSLKETLRDRQSAFNASFYRLKVSFINHIKIELESSRGGELITYLDNY